MGTLPMLRMVAWAPYPCSYFFFTSISVAVIL